MVAVDSVYCYSCCS